jgi:hypothetical protein
MSADLVAQIARAGGQIIAAPASGIADELNRQLNQVLAGRSRRRAALRSTARVNNRAVRHGALIFTRVQGAHVTGHVSRGSPPRQPGTMSSLLGFAQAGRHSGIARAF